MDILDYIGEKVEFDENSGFIVAKDEIANSKMICEIRGWSTIYSEFRNSDETKDFQNSVGEWIASAINEKLERERNNGSI